MDPSKSFYYYWTFAVYIGFLYNAMMCVIFVYDDTQGVFLYYWIAGNVFFDMVFVFDIIVNAKLSKWFIAEAVEYKCDVAYMEDGLTVRQWRRLAKRYIRR